MQPFLWKNIGESTPISGGEPPEHVPGAVNRDKGRVKSVFARFREQSRRRRRTPGKRVHQDHLAPCDEVQTPSTSRSMGPHLRPPFNVQKDIRFYSISSESPGAAPFDSALPTCSIAGRVATTTSSNRFERQLSLTQEGQKSVWPLKTTQPLSRNPGPFKSVGKENVTLTPPKFQCAPVACPQMGDTNPPFPRMVQTFVEPSLPVQFVRGLIATKPPPQNQQLKTKILPDDTGDTGDSTFQHKSDSPEENFEKEDKKVEGKEKECEKVKKAEEKASSHTDSSTESENIPEQSNPEEEEHTESRFSRSDSVEPHEACQSSKPLQDSQSVPNLRGSITPGLSTRDGEAYKSVLLEIKKQNEAFQESWKRLEERLERLENVLSSVYKRGEPTMTGEEEEPWDFSQGFVVNEAESLDLIVDLANVDDPVVSKRLYTAKGVIKPVVTSNENDKTIVREWDTKRPPGWQEESEQVADDVGKKFINEEGIKVQSLNEKKWASLEYSPGEPRIVDFEETLRSARLKAFESDQRLNWRPRSFEAWQSAPRKASRRGFLRSKRTVRDDVNDDSEKVVKTEVSERRRFRPGGIQGPVEQTESNQIHSHAEGGMKSKRLIRNGDSEKKNNRFMKLKLPTWMFRRKNKEKNIEWRAPAPIEDEAAEAVETLPRPVETSIRIDVNPKKKTRSENENGHHIQEVESVMKLMREEIVRKRRLDESTQASKQVCTATHCKEENELEDASLDDDNAVLAMQEFLEKRNMQAGSKHKMGKAGYASESAESDRIFWFEGNQRPGPTREKVVCKQIQDGPKCREPEYILSQFYGENPSRSFLYSYEKSATGERDQMPFSSGFSSKMTNERSTSTTSIVKRPIDAEFDQMTPQIASKLEEADSEETIEERRRRKALKARLRVSSYVKDTTPVLTNLCSTDAPISFPLTTTDRYDSAASILRRRLDASPLRNPEVCGCSGIVCSDSVHVTLGPSCEFRVPESQQYRKGKQDMPSKECAFPKCQGNIVGPGNSVTDPNSGLVVRAECDQVKIMLPKLAGKNMDRVLVEVEHNEATEKKMEDGRCVPILSKELNRDVPTPQNEKKTKKTRGAKKKAEKEIGHDICSLRRLSSHSLEELVLKGYESADRVLHDRLDEEIETLGVPKEDCIENPQKDKKFVDRLMRQFKTKKYDRTNPCRSRLASVGEDELRFGHSDRFQKDGLRHTYIEAVRTEPSHRFHFRESEGKLNEHLRPCRHRRHLRREDHCPGLDAETTVLEYEPGKCHPQKPKRSFQRRSKRPVFAGPVNSSTDSETKELLLQKHIDKKSEEISGVVSRSKRDGKTVETFMFNPLYAPISRNGKKNVTWTGIISKLFPSLQEDVERKSSVRIHSSLKLHTPDGQIYRLDSESHEKRSADQRLADSKVSQSSEDSCAEHCQHIDIHDQPSHAGSPIGVRKSLKETANQKIALKSRKSTSNEQYTVFSEKIYFLNSTDNVNTKPDDGCVHVETITISYPVSGKEERSDVNLGERQFRSVRKCKTGALSQKDDSQCDFVLPKRSRRRTKHLLNIANSNAQHSVTDSENGGRKVHRRVKKRREAWK